MPTFTIAFLETAEDDLAWFRPNERKIIYDGIIRILATGAETESKRRKRLRPNPLAPWELRLGMYRVFYEVVDVSKVRILAIGYKEHNDLFIRGERVQL
jgi:mRNA-degrading endonuclease RelE of RelBE toxin-antitoxin system